MSNPYWHKKWWIFAWANPEWNSNMLSSVILIDDQGAWSCIHGRLYVMLARHLPDDRI
jgi:hypothetical protein